MERDKELIEEVGFLLKAAAVIRENGRKKSYGKRRRFPSGNKVLNGLANIYIGRKVALLCALPNEILDTVEDMQEFSIGIMTEKTEALLQAYYDEKKKRE